MCGRRRGARCFWCAGDPLYRSYHDREWGFPVTDDQRLFEKIALEGFQAGLSWLTILRKRENFRRAFHGFAIERVAKMGARDVTRLLGDAGIVRHRGKIESAIHNAKQSMTLIERHGSLASFVWRFDPPVKERPRADEGRRGEAHRDAHLAGALEGAACGGLLLRRADYDVRLHAGDGSGERSPRGLRGARACANGTRELSLPVGGRMRTALVAALALAAGFRFPSPGGAETQSNAARFFDRLSGRLEDPAGRRGSADDAVGPGSAMNVSVAAASRPDFDADRFSDAELQRIGDRLAASVAGELKNFELVERGAATLGGKRAAYFRWRALSELPSGRVETVGYYVATAHRGLVYSVTGVTQARLAKRMQPRILDAIQSFRFIETSVPGEAREGGGLARGAR